MSVPMQNLVDVTWDGLALMALSDELDCIVRNVEGWYDTAAIEPHDVNRELSDGGLYGPKVFHPRDITITGVAVGKRAPLIGFRDAIVRRVANNLPTDLSISDPWLGYSLTATVRAYEQYKHTFTGNYMFAYQLLLRAADPRRYGQTWRQVILSTGTEGASGRFYPRTYPWTYGSPDLPSSALLTNSGDAPAPVYATYQGTVTGPGGSSRLSQETPDNNELIVATVAAGVNIIIDTGTLVAQAEGGASRASYILPGSAPLLIPPNSTIRWSLAGTGDGHIVLNWRDTYL